MARGWSKGLTKDNHPSLQKRSETMKARKLDNFKIWRQKAKEEGIIPSSYPALIRNGDLAEFIGVILGDGHIEKFPRTERLLIFSNSANQGFIKRYSRIMKEVFDKSPNIYKISGANCVRIGIYQKNISKRLGIPTGARKELDYELPAWIESNKKNLLRFLRGLYEAEGSYSVHLPTYTHKFSFANTNQSLLKIVDKSLRVLGFSPSIDKLRVQLSRQREVEGAMKLLEFRNY